MRYQMLKLTAAFVILSPSSCATLSDSYCTTYIPIITEKGDGAMTATPNVKRRLLANELTYRDLCKG